MSQHPQVIEGTKRIIGISPTGQQLMAWDEIYPDGSIKSFGEFWYVVKAASGTSYSGPMVRQLTA